MRRLFLVAGAASLAIAGAAVAKPGGGGGGGNPHGGGGGGGNPHAEGGPPAFAGGGNGHGGGGGPPAFAGGGHENGGGPHGGGPPVFMGGGGHGRGATFMGGGGGRARAFESAPGRGAEGHGRGTFMAPQMRSYAVGGGRGHGGGAGRDQFGALAGGTHGHGGGRQQARAFAGGSRGHERQGFARQEPRAFPGGGGHRAANHGNAFARQQGGPVARPQVQMAQGGQIRGQAQRQAIGGNFQRLGGAAALGAAGAQFANQQPLYQQNWGGVSPYETLSYGNNVQILPVQQVQQFVGVPVSNVATYAALAPLPASIQYLYPDTPDYYYQWGDGYLYQVDRSDNLVAALLPLLAGGYLPGQYLPQPYMASYVPAYYGLDSFYPDYGGVCNRYYDGVVYQVDCASGYVENVAPMYAGGYGVGQLLPTAYNYYNVPVQYRSLYYNTADYGYWYSPGAIYQYDPRTSVITSVAALMSPGFAVGQPLPVGYDVYNVPYAYRATYYDTPDAWYRYNNGYIYQIDPVTQLVTAIVASLLT